MKHIIKAIIIVTLFVSFASAQEQSRTIWLDSLDTKLIVQGFYREGKTGLWGIPYPNQTVLKNPLSIKGKVFKRGIGTHADSEILIDLKGAGIAFKSMIGVDDEVRNTNASVVFQIFADGKQIFDSGIMNPGMKPKEVDIDISNSKKMLLVVTDAGDGIDNDHADWADARIIMKADSDALPEAIPVHEEPKTILTPPAPDEPRINSARAFGASAGSPFLFTIATSGKRPMEFSAQDLPEGLSLDEGTGIITGKANKKGKFKVLVTASNSAGKAEEEILIVIGKKLALTPPMGWNSWNAFGETVDDEKIRATADAIVSKGLINYGWTYINIDDFWQEKRDPETGEIVTFDKFPDMKALADYVHSKGLKIGIYSSPGLKTCGGCEGSLGYECQDARTYAAWGLDYLKHDWCSGSSRGFQGAYKLMYKCLKKTGRDIIYSLCNYGLDYVFVWGKKVGGNLWRTTYDISDNWGSMTWIGFNQNHLAEFAGPGHWNDPDMLVVGTLGWGKGLYKTHLTPNEQYTHISLWCLLSSPLLLGCDLTKLDDFTLNLLTNNEVIAVNQDVLGIQATRKHKKGKFEVWSKPLHDGSIAVGLFNRGFNEAKHTVNWSFLEIDGEYTVRDLWRQKDLGEFKDSFSTTIPRHGVALLKFTKK